MHDARHPWRVTEGQMLRRCEWDDEVVLFNDLSGATHLLSPTACWLLDRLAVNPDDVPGLATALEAELAAQAASDHAGNADGADSANIDHALLAELLADLHSLDLVAPC